MEKKNNTLVQKIIVGVLIFLILGVLGFGLYKREFMDPSHCSRLVYETIIRRGQVVTINEKVLHNVCLEEDAEVTFKSNIRGKLKNNGAAILLEPFRGEIENYGHIIAMDALRTDKPVKNDGTLVIRNSFRANIENNGYLEFYHSGMGTITTTNDNIKVADNIKDGFYNKVKVKRK